MNQGIAFARTIRALDADDFGPSKLTLAFAVILLAAWTWWMLAARVPQYRTTTTVRLESGRALAYFSSTGEIRPGQTAFVTIGGHAIAARVQSVAPDHADLVFTNNQQPRTNNQHPTTARVEVSSVSPAAIAFRTLGRARQ
jgi:hypothetical protein